MLPLCKLNDSAFKKNLIAVIVIIGLFFTISMAQSKPRILVFTKTQGYDHATREVADSLIRALGAENGFDVDTTNVSTGYFTDVKLAAYKAVCFTNTTGTLLTDSEKVAFERYFKAGGGYVGMHASADCEYSWHWYHEMLGAYFVGHPFNIVPAKLAVLDHNHASTQFIKKDTISLADEWYFFANSPNDSSIDPAKLPNLHVLINLVESSLSNSTQSKFHPICWYQNFQGGRAWYTGFGHQSSYYRDTTVQKNLLGGIMWAAGMTATGTSYTKDNFSIVSPTARAAVYDISGKRIRMLDRRDNAIAAGRWWDNNDDFGRSVAPGRYCITIKNGTSCIIKPMSITK